jgi:uncharacterized protein YbjT (DUF2867 family)
MDINKKTALIIGSTGLVGGQCLSLLLQSPYYNKVIAITRRKIEGIAQPDTPKLENLVIDFGNLAQYSTQIKADDIYCAMGTTIGTAGSQAAFKLVDFEIPMQVAAMAKKNGAGKFILVSSLGADAGSKIFYNRTKGELEEGLKKLNYNSLIIFRPSILLGNRKEKRYGEAAGRWVAEKLPFLFSGPLRKYKGTPVDMLARVMVSSANRKQDKVRIIENEEIFKLDAEK